MRAAVKVNPMDTLRQLPENKKCFDCQQKVSTNFYLNIISLSLSVNPYRLFASNRVPCIAL